MALLVVLFSQADAQKIRRGKWELGIMAGGSNYHGDLASEIVLKETHFSTGILMKNNLSKYMAYRIQLCYGAISGHDKNFKNYNYRALLFKSNIWELGGQFEFNFRAFGINPTEKHSTAYLVTGLNVFAFNPKVRYGSGDWIEARNIGTEGQGLDNYKKRYSLIQLSVPMGMGYKISINKNLVLGFETVFRKTFTDYLDDVSGEYPDYQTMKDKKGDLAAELSQPQTLSGGKVIVDKTQRGDPHLKDWYFITAFTLTYRFVTLGKCPQF
ncbi:MAG: hypothetical protein H7321_08115 [Bacteroidia bacterium]|nr:hypothetical protein [Bacteroidia bacterium]